MTASTDEGFPGVLECGCCLLSVEGTLDDDLIRSSLNDFNDCWGNNMMTLLLSSIAKGLG